MVVVDELVDEEVDEVDDEDELEDVDDEVRQIAPKELSAPDLFEDDEDLDEESNDEK